MGNQSSGKNRGSRGRSGGSMRPAMFRGRRRLAFEEGINKPGFGSIRRRSAAEKAADAARRAAIRRLPQRPRFRANR